MQPKKVILTIKGKKGLNLRIFLLFHISFIFYSIFVDSSNDKVSKFDPDEYDDYEFKEPKTFREKVFVLFSFCWWLSLMVRTLRLLRMVVCSFSCLFLPVLQFASSTPPENCFQVEWILIACSQKCSKWCDTMTRFWSGSTKHNKHYSINSQVQRIVGDGVKGFGRDTGRNTEGRRNLVDSYKYCYFSILIKQKDIKQLIGLDTQPLTAANGHESVSTWRAVVAKFTYGQRYYNTFILMACYQHAINTGIEQDGSQWICLCDLSECPHGTRVDNSGQSREFGGWAVGWGRRRPSGQIPPQEDLT